MKKKLLRLFKHEEGIEIVEWALLCAGFALGMIVVFPTLVSVLETFYGRIGTALEGTPAP
jgi:Flp pilus assembly pilin Flp